MLTGDPADWLKHFVSIEDRLVEAVEAVWPACILPLRLAKNEMTHEDFITNHLVDALIRKRMVPGRIVPQYALLGPNQQNLLQVSSKIDFVVTIGDDEQVYLACECKRLNVPYRHRTRPLAHEYVRDGLSRFITEQYAQGLPLAMMIGYVMDAQVAFANTRVMKAIHRAKSIGMQSVVSLPPKAGRSLRFSTVHVRSGGPDIEVRHTLLGWP